MGDSMSRSGPEIAADSEGRNRDIDLNDFSHTLRARSSEIGNSRKRRRNFARVGEWSTISTNIIR